MIAAVSIPVPPSVNHYTMPRAGKRGKRSLTPVAREYKRQVAILLKESRQITPAKPSQARLECHVMIHFGSNHKRDLDNYMKLTLDSLQGVIYDDDKQIDKLIIERGQVVAGGKVLIWVYEMEDKDANTDRI